MHPRVWWGYRLQPGAFIGACPGWRCPFARNFVRGINLVDSSLANVLHKGAAQAWWQPMSLADLGQWPTVHIP